jgi:serine/threonine-protein kinase
MARLFPEPQDRYPVVYLKDTDIELPKHVRNTSMRYTNFKTIAKGGKCLIQSCHDYYLSRTVAYKSLRKEIADDPFEQRRFVREARVTANLQHPNTIPIYELSRDTTGHYYFTMKLVEGETLKEVLEAQAESEHERLDGYGLHRMVTILIQIGNALDYAHTHGVVHRDVKPANILMGPFGEVLLLDWGLAKVWSMQPEEVPDLPLLSNQDPSLTAQGRLQGTALYMSPEQIAESQDIDHRTDIYSLGVVLYEVLTLQHMFGDEKLEDLLEKGKTERPEWPSKKAPQRRIPGELEEICMRCLEKDPDDRVQTARELVSELRSWRMRWAAGG